MVPKKLLDDAHEASERLRQKLDEVVSLHKRDHEEAVRALQYQLKTVQGQYRTAEDQLKRSMQRERDLRDQLSNADVSSILSKIRLENKALKDEIQGLKDTLSTMPEDLENSRREAASLREELSSWQAEHTHLVKMHEMQLSELKAEHQAKVKALEDEISAQKLDEERRFQEYEDRFTLCESRSQQIMEENQELKAILQQTHTLVAGSQEAATVSAKRVADLERETNELHRQLGDKAGEIRALEAHVKVIEERSASQEAQLYKMQQDAGALNKKILETELELSNAVESNRQTIESLKRENEKLELQVIPPVPFGVRPSSQVQPPTRNSLRVLRIIIAERMESGPHCPLLRSAWVAGGGPRSRIACGRSRTRTRSSTAPRWTARACASSTARSCARRRRRRGRCGGPAACGGGCRARLCAGCFD